MPGPTQARARPAMGTLRTTRFSRVTMRAGQRGRDWAKDVSRQPSNRRRLPLSHVDGDDFNYPAIDALLEVRISAD